MNFKENVNLLKIKLDKASKIGIISHIKPDGDNLGSLFSLGTVLKRQYGDKIDILKSDNIPDKYNFLSNYNKAIEPNKDTIYDVVIVLDCGDEKRLGKYEHVLNGAVVVNIDHHISNKSFGDINFVYSDASSTGEIVYKILKQMNIKIDKEIATCIYVAISTDTGSFKYDNTTKETHEIAGKLLDLGIDLNNITKRVYQSIKLNDALYFIRTLKNIEFFYDYRLAIVCSSNVNGYNNQDTEGIVEYARDIDTVEVACFIKEIEENKVKVSLRSKSYVDVAKIAEKFDGGGHVRAAGFTLCNTIDCVKDKIILEIEKYLG